MAARIEIFQGKDNDWYWRRVSVNERIIATGGEGYTNQVDAAKMVKQLFPGLEIYVIDEKPLPPA